MTSGKRKYSKKPMWLLSPSGATRGFLLYLKAESEPWSSKAPRAALGGPGWSGQSDWDERKEAAGKKPLLSSVNDGPLPTLAWRAAELV